MVASGAKALPTVAFLTVIEDAELGITGGLLVLNVAGRPVEFHCTAPVKPNRAQEILYGPTLRPFLYGEQIGQTLLSKAKSESLFVCTDVEQVMCVREGICSPVVLVRASGEARAAMLDRVNATSHRIDAAHSGLRPAFPRLSDFALGNQFVAVLAQYESDRETIVERWQPYDQHLDLSEPFGRIREALHEAQRGAGK